MNVRCFSGSPNTPIPPTTTTVNVTSTTSGQREGHDVTASHTDSFSMKDTVADGSEQIVNQGEAVAGKFILNDGIGPYVDKLAIRFAISS